MKQRNGVRWDWQLPFCYSVEGEVNDRGNTVRYNKSSEGSIHNSFTEAVDEPFMRRESVRRVKVEPSNTAGRNPTPKRQRFSAATPSHKSSLTDAAPDVIVISDDDNNTCDNALHPAASHNVEVSGPRISAVCDGRGKTATPEEEENAAPWKQEVDDDNGMAGGCRHTPDGNSPAIPANFISPPSPSLPLLPHPIIISPPLPPEPHPITTTTTTLSTTGDTTNGGTSPTCTIPSQIPNDTEAPSLFVPDFHGTVPSEVSMEKSDTVSINDILAIDRWPILDQILVTQRGLESCPSPIAIPVIPQIPNTNQSEPASLSPLTSLLSPSPLLHSAPPTPETTVPEVSTTTTTTSTSVTTEPQSTIIAVNSSVTDRGTPPRVVHQRRWLRKKRDEAPKKVRNHEIRPMQSVVVLVKSSPGPIPKTPTTPTKKLAATAQINSPKSPQKPTNMSEAANSQNNKSPAPDPAPQPQHIRCEQLQNGRMSTPARRSAMGSLPPPYSTGTLRAQRMQELELISMVGATENDLRTALLQQIGETLATITLNEAAVEASRYGNTFSLLEALSLKKKFIPIESPAMCGSLSFDCDLATMTKSISEFGIVSQVLSVPAKPVCIPSTTSIQIETSIPTESTALLKWKLVDRNSTAEQLYTATPIFEVQLAKLLPSESEADSAFRLVYSGKAPSYECTALQPDTKYSSRIRALIAPANSDSSSSASASASSALNYSSTTEWAEATFTTLPKVMFSKPGRFTFTVPEGVTRISAIVIGGGAAGGSWCNGSPCGGGDGGPSEVAGVVEAGGGEGGKRRAGLGGEGTEADGGRGGEMAAGGSGTMWPRSGGGGAAGGEGRRDQREECGDAANLPYAGAGGNGMGCGLPQARGGEEEDPLATHGGMDGGRPGRDYGGGGGGALSWGGGGGGYSVVENHPVEPGQRLPVVVGAGGAPKSDNTEFVGGSGATGLNASITIYFGSIFSPRSMNDYDEAPQPQAPKRSRIHPQPTHDHEGDADDEPSTQPQRYPEAEQGTTAAPPPPRTAPTANNTSVSGTMATSCSSASAAAPSLVFPGPASSSSSSSSTSTTTQHLRATCERCGVPYLVMTSVCGGAQASSSSSSSYGCGSNGGVPELVAMTSDRHPVLLSPCGRCICSVCLAACNLASIDDTPALDDSIYPTDSATEAALPDGKSGICPVCVEPHVVTGVKGNARLVELLKMLHNVGCTTQLQFAGGDSEKETMCQECGTKKAATWCEKEETALCIDCDKATHSFRITQSHVRVPIEQRALSLAKKAQREPKCPQHPGKDLDTLCCVICKDFCGHKGHNAVYRGDACCAARQVLLEKTCQCVNFTESASSTVTKLQRELNEFAIHVGIAKDNIRKQFEALHEELKRREAHLVSVLDETANHASNAIQKQIISLFYIRLFLLISENSTDETVFSIEEAREVNEALMQVVNCDNTYSIMQMLSILKRPLVVFEVADNSGDLISIGPRPTPLTCGKLSFLCDTTAFTKSLATVGTFIHLPLLETEASIKGNVALVKWRLTPSDTTSFTVMPDTFEVQLLQQSENEECIPTGIKPSFQCGGAREIELGPLQPDTKYVAKVRAFLSTMADHQEGSTEWSEVTFHTPARVMFNKPGMFTFTVPEGVTSINAIAIGGGAAGGSLYKAHPLYQGCDGGVSALTGIVEAEGGRGPTGGNGTTSRGGDGAQAQKVPNDQWAVVGGCGGAAGGGGASAGDAGAQGASPTAPLREYAGRGGSGGGHVPMGPHGVAGGEAGQDYGGGGGGSWAPGGGGGGYSVARNCAVTPGQVLSVVVGAGGVPGVPRPVTAPGGPGGCGLVTRLNKKKWYRKQERLVQLKKRQLLDQQIANWATIRPPTTTVVAPPTTTTSTTTAPLSAFPTWWASPSGSGAAPIVISDGEEKEDADTGAGAYDEPPGDYDPGPEEEEEDEDEDEEEEEEEEEEDEDEDEEIEEDEEAAEEKGGNDQQQDAKMIGDGRGNQKLGATGTDTTSCTTATAQAQPSSTNTTLPTANTGQPHAVLPGCCSAGSADMNIKTENKPETTPDITCTPTSSTSISTNTNTTADSNSTTCSDNTSPAVVSQEQLPELSSLCKCCGTSFLRATDSIVSEATSSTATAAAATSTTTTANSDPVLLLPCGHNVCGRCWAASNINAVTSDDSMLTGSVHTTISKENRICPECKAPVCYQKENLLLVTLLKLMNTAGCILEQDKPKLKPETMCQECAVKKATVWCETEEIVLCAECDKATHAFKISQTHKRVPVEKRPAPKMKEPTCPLHPGKDLDIYCATDNVMCCVICKDFGPHKGHSAFFRDDIYNSSRELLVFAAQKSLSALNTRRSRAAYQTCFAIREAVNTQELQLLSTLDTIKSTLSQQINEHEVSALQSIEYNKGVMQMAHSSGATPFIRLRRTLLTPYLGDMAQTVSEQISSQLVASQIDARMALPQSSGGKVGLILDLPRVLSSVQNFASLIQVPSLQVQHTFTMGGDIFIQWKFEQNSSPTSAVVAVQASLFDTFEVELSQSTASSPQQPQQFQKIYSGPEKMFHLKNSQQGTKYFARVRALFCSTKTPPLSAATTASAASSSSSTPSDVITTSWSEITFTTPNRTFFIIPPGTPYPPQASIAFAFTVPPGVTSITAVAIGGGAAGASWATRGACPGTDGGDSGIDGILLATGGKGGASQAPGGIGTVANGGNGGQTAPTAPTLAWRTAQHGGGGAAGGSSGEGVEGGGRGGAATLDFAGRGGGSAACWGAPGVASGYGTVAPADDKGGKAGWDYGGGGGGCFGAGGGGGGYSAVRSHPVSPGQALRVVVGCGGQPRSDTHTGHMGGRGGSGLVAISWFTS
ncbi:hypothetical protein Pelo_1198 [Pelomyxa schiedti]|nr:hypothetical protein Pelo_1198 [Pelomyxa schiedti]